MYIIISEYSKERLAKTVTEYMSRDWCCQGGILIELTPQGYLYSQAVVKEA